MKLLLRLLLLLRGGKLLSIKLLLLLLLLLLRCGGKLLNMKLLLLLLLLLRGGKLLV